MKTRIMNPILAEAIDHNAFGASAGQTKNGVPGTPKISVNDEFLRKRQVKVEEMSSSAKQKTDLNRYYV